jgi:hypothetical protein
MRCLLRALLRAKADDEPRTLTTTTTLTMHPQLALHRQSLHDREAFWLRAARDIHWHQPPSVAYGKTTLSEQAAPYAQGDGTWFPNAQREWPEACSGARACRCAAHAARC